MTAMFAITALGANLEASNGSYNDGNLSDESLTATNASAVGVNLTNLLDATNGWIGADIMIFDKDGELVNSSVIPSDIYTINISVTDTIPIQRIDIINANISANTSALVQIHDTTNNLTSLGEVYSINPLVTNFTEGSIHALASPSAKWLFKCASWNFTTQKCTDGKWTRLQRLTPGEVYSINFTPGDPGYGESNTTITVIDSNETLVEYDETIIANESGIMEVAINLTNRTRISSILIRGYNASPTNETTDTFRIDPDLDINYSTTRFLSTYLIDPTGLNFLNATITINTTGTQLYKCTIWDSPSKTCMNEWALVKLNLTAGLYTFTLTPEDPAFAETTTSNTSFNEGTYSNTSYNEANGAVQLNASTTSGEYTSKVFDGGVDTARWRNISWTQQICHSCSLPNNSDIETGNFAEPANMTGNVLLLHLDEQNGALADSSGLGHNGAASGPTYGEAGMFGTGLRFGPEATDNMTVPGSATLNITGDITIAFWANITATTHSSWNYFAKHGSTKYEVGIYGTDMKPRFKAYNDSGTSFEIAGNATTTGRWYHITAVREGTNLRIYVNGIQHNSLSTFVGNLRSGTKLQIGGDGSTSGINATIDEFAIWNRSLSATEILNMYKRGILRLNLTARTCDDSACSGESFNDTGDLSPQNLALATNRYFQYRYLFTTQDGNHSPRLYNATLSYTSPLNITFISPTPANASTVTSNSVYVNVTFTNGNATTARLEWNGANETMLNISTDRWHLNKTGLTSGTFNFKVLANDTQTGDFDVSETRTVTIESVPPTVLNAQPADGTAFAQDISVTVSANITDDSGIGTAVANITLPNGSLRVLALTLGANNTYVSTMNETNLTGRYNVTFIANDTIGNANATVNNFFLINDTTRPRVLSPISAPATANQSDTINLSANFSDNVGPGAILFQVSAPNASALNLTGTVSSKDVYSGSYTTTSSHPIGNHTVRIIANDTSGNVNASITTSFTVSDITNPAVNNLLTNPAAANQSDTINITVNASDNTAVDDVLVQVTRANGSAFNTTATFLSGITYNCTITTTPNDPPGLWNVTILTNDTSGNLNTTGPVNFTLTDTIPPSVINASAASVPLGNATRIAANATDNIAVDTVLINVTLPNGTVRTISATKTGDIYNGTFTETNVPDIFNFTILANDTSGNRNFTMRGIFTVNDTTPPVIVLNSPANSTKFNLTDIVNISVNASDDVAIATVIAYVVLPNASVEARTLSVHSGQVFIAPFTNLTLRGRYNITIFANDTSGLHNSTSTGFDRTSSDQDIIDVLDQNAGRLIFPSVTQLRNVSDVLDLNMSTSNQTILSITVYNHTFGAQRDLIRVANSTNDSRVFTQTYFIDFTDFNLTSGEIIVRAIGQNLYKCVRTNLSSKQCEDRANYTFERTDLTPGQLYKFNITENDPAFGETLDGPNETQDSWLNEQFVNQVNGQQEFMRVGTGSGVRRRGIIRFNLSSIPLGVNITNATLQIYLIAVPGGNEGGNRTHALHRINQSPARSWIEDNVTWAAYNDTSNWTLAGGDFVRAQNANATFDNTSLETYINFNVTSDLQILLDNQSFNFGWIIIDTNETTNLTQRDYQTSESTNISKRPIIAITFIDVSAPAVVLISPISGSTGDVNTTVTLTVNATDFFNISNVIANLTLPNGSVRTVALSNLTKDVFNTTFNETPHNGTYLIVFIANDTSGNINRTVTSNITLSIPTAAPAPAAGGGGGGGGGSRSYQLQESAAVTTALSCMDRCRLNDTRCFGNDIQICVNTSGCLDWSTRAVCQSEKECDKGACVTPCIEQWTCEDWNTCIDGTETRGCIDINACGTATQRPSDSQSCEDRVTGAATKPIVEIPATARPTTTLNEPTPTTSAFARWLLALLALTLIAGRAAFVYTGGSIGGRKAVVADQDNYIFVPMEPDHHTIKLGIHSVKLEKIHDMDVVLEILRNGDSIVLIDISFYTDKVDRLKRMVKKLKHTISAINGDLVGFGDSWIVAATKGIFVERKPPVQKQRDPFAIACALGKMPDWSQFDEWNRRRKEEKAKEREQKYSKGHKYFCLPL